MLKGVQCKICPIYRDEVIVMGGTFEQGLEYLNQVFKRVSRAGLRLYPTKFNLFQKESFLANDVTLATSYGYCQSQKNNDIQT